MIIKKSFMLLITTSLLFLHLLMCSAESAKSVQMQLPDCIRSFSTEDLADNNQLAETYLGRIMSSNRRTMLRARSARGDRLSGAPGNLYTLLRGDISDIASGVRTSSEMTYNAEDVYEQTSYTTSDLGITSILNEADEFTQEAIDAINTIVIFDSRTVVQSLLADCPYELYWYDKTAGFVVEYPSQLSTDGETVTISGNVVVYLHVSSDYALNGANYQCNPTYGQSAQAAANNARNIVNKYIDSTDEEKLAGYADEICSLTSYNYEAASGGTSYGNPWQLIWVFDGNPNTEVVCEGYAKAFQYLCDLTTFAGNVGVITVTGTMTGGTGAGAHMWNVVNLDDGNNYLVDVTNIDEGTVGYPDQLILAECTSGEILNGYSLTTSNGMLVYMYDAETLGLYSEEEIALNGSSNVLENVVAYGPTDCGQMWFLYDDGLLYIKGTGVLSKDPWGPYYENIKRVVISEGIEAIGGCSNFVRYPELEEIQFPDTLESISVLLCENPKLKSVNIPPRVSKLFQATFTRDPLLNIDCLPEGLLSIDKFCFDGCTSLNISSFPTTLESIGESAFRDCANLQRITISNGSIGKYAFTGCSALESIVLADGVDSIAEGAFADNTALTSVRLPSGLVNVPRNAFGGCINLSSINIPVSITTIEEQAFQNCGCLQYVDMPNGLISIGDAAFSRSGLKSISIPNSVLSIGTWAFDDCYELTEVTLGQQVSSIGNYAFRGCGIKELTLPASIQHINARIFYNSSLENIYIDDDNSQYCDINGIVYSKDMSRIVCCPPRRSGEITIASGVTEICELAFAYSSASLIHIPNTLMSIGEYAFESSPSLETLSLPNTITELPVGMCNFCNALSTVVLPDALVTIGAKAFRGCSRLSELFIPATIEYIGDDAFAACYSLSITIDNNNQYYSYVDGLLLTKDGKTLVSAFRLSDRIIHIPTGVETISSESFSGEMDLEEVYFPETVKTIGDNAFYGCENLHTVVFNGTLSLIEQSAFSDCYSLTDVTIPVEHITIEDGAFNNCTSLSSITISGTIESLGSSVFTSCNSLTSVTFGPIISHVGANLFSDTSYYEDKNNWCDNLFIISDWIMGSDGVSGKINLPAGIVGLADYSFSFNNKIREVTCPASLRVIGDGAFQSCSNLEAVHLNQGIKNLGQFAFSGCNIGALRIPSSLEYIGYSFLYTQNGSNAPLYAPDPLASLGFPSTLLVFEGNAPVLNDKAFLNIAPAIVFYPYNNSTWENVIGLQYGSHTVSITGPSGTVSLHNGVTWVPYNPSTGSTFFPTVTLPTQLDTIEEYAFENCPFTVVKIPDGVSVIREMAFSNCTSLTQIYIPSSVNTIADSALSGCNEVLIIGSANGEAAIFALKNGFIFVRIEDMKVPSF